MLRLGSALFVLGALAVAVPANAATKSPAMESCSAEWAKMKADNKVPAGTTWPKFWSDCSKAYAAAHPDPAGKMAATPAATETPPEPPAAAPNAMKAAPNAMKASPNAMTASPTAMKAAPNAMKAAAPVPTPAPVATEAGLTVPASPDDAAKIDATKPKKEQTPGQKAATLRIKACGAEWQAAKKAGTLPADAKWPKYWSDCNKRLKAQGQ